MYNNFNGFGNYGQPYFPAQYNVQQQQTQNVPTNTNKIYVSGLNDVNTRPQPAGSDFVYLHNDKPLLYQKKVDSNGHFEIKTFDIVEHKEDAGEKQEYVSKSDFDTLQKRLTAMESKLNTLSAKKDEGGKTNGTAGNI